MLRDQLAILSALASTSEIWSYTFAAARSELDTKDKKKNNPVLRYQFAFDKIYEHANHSSLVVEEEFKGEYSQANVVNSNGVAEQDYKMMSDDYDFLDPQDLFQQSEQMPVNEPEFEEEFKTPGEF